MPITVVFFVEGYRVTSFPGVCAREHANPKSTNKHVKLVYFQASMMKVLMDRNLDQQSIIKFYDGFSTDKYLAFEVLDISLIQYINERKAPMRLQDIRAVIQQVWHQRESETGR